MIHIVTRDFEGEHTGDRDGRRDMRSESWPFSFFPLATRRAVVSDLTTGPKPAELIERSPPRAPLKMLAVMRMYDRFENPLFL